MASKKEQHLNLKFQSMVNNQKSDTDEVFQHFRKLQLEKQKLQDEIASVDHECNVLKEILLCKSKEEVRNIFDEFYPNSGIVHETSKEREEINLRNANKFNSYCVQELLGIRVRKTENEKYIVDFLPPDNYESQNLTTISLFKDEDDYSLDHFILPPVVPVKELEKKYITEKKSIGVFINYIYNYLLCYWARDIEVKKLKIDKNLENSLIYHNRDRTVISFTLSFLNKFDVEISLRYDPLSCIPSSVKFIESEGRTLPEDLSSALDSLKQSLLQHLVSEVLELNMTGNDDSQKSSDNDKKDSNSITSESTLVLNLFK